MALPGHFDSCMQRACVWHVLTNCAQWSAGGTRRRRGGRRASGGHCTRCEGGRGKGCQRLECGLGRSEGADCSDCGAADHRDAGRSGQLCFKRGAPLRCAACSRAAGLANRATVSMQPCPSRGPVEGHACIVNGFLVVLLAQWARLKGVVASWVPAGTSWRVLLAMFLLGALAGAGLTMMAHPHAWCRHHARHFAWNPSPAARPQLLCTLPGRSATVRKIAVLLQQARCAAKDKRCGDGRQRRRRHTIPQRQPGMVRSLPPRPVVQPGDAAH